MICVKFHKRYQGLGQSDKIQKTEVLNHHILLNNLVTIGIQYFTTQVLTKVNPKNTHFI